MMDKRLAEIAERVAKATPGPWVPGRLDMVSQDYGDDNIYKNVYCPDSSTPEMHLGKPLPTIVARGYEALGVDCRDNAVFIANARDDVPWLLRQVELLRQIAEAARRVDSYEDFSDPIVSDEYDPTEHNAARLKLYQVLGALREFNRDGENNGSE